MDGYKHYIRVDVNSIVIDRYSEWEGKYQSGDILVETTELRHYNFPITNERGQYIYKWIGSAMVLRTDAEMFDLAQYKTLKINLLSAICQTAILSDFTSNALGTIHTYGFDEIDQRNIQGIGINIAIDTTLTSVDWKTRESVTMIAHTRDQMVQVIKDAATHQKSSQYKYLNLKKQVIEATDKTSIDAIVW